MFARQRSTLHTFIGRMIDDRTGQMHTGGRAGVGDVRGLFPFACAVRALERVDGGVVVRSLDEWWELPLSAGIQGCVHHP